MMKSFIWHSINFSLREGDLFLGSQLQDYKVSCKHDIKLNYGFWSILSTWLIHFPRLSHSHKANYGLQSILSTWLIHFSRLSHSHKPNYWLQSILSTWLIHFPRLSHSHKANFGEPINIFHCIATKDFSYTN